MRDALIRALLVAPFLLIFWAAVEWRSGSRRGFTRAFCALGIHRWQRILTDPGRIPLGRYCPNCRRAEHSQDDAPASVPEGSSNEALQATAVHADRPGPSAQNQDTSSGA